jgi:hypothetical protein
MRQQMSVIGAAQTGDRRGQSHGHTDSGTKAIQPRPRPKPKQGTCAAHPRASPPCPRCRSDGRHRPPDRAERAKLGARVIKHAR